MSNIEPTEEQKQAAREACWSLNGSLHHNVARLLAKREAKLREERDSARSELQRRVFVVVARTMAWCGHTEVWARDCARDVFDRLTKGET